jgi:hypothetical protein
MTTPPRDPIASAAAGVPSSEHRREIPADRDAALEAVEEAAEAWGAAWTRQGTGGDLALPILAGLHRGWVRAQVTADPAGAERTALRLSVVERHEGIHVQAVVILLFSVAGGILVVLWPFFPRLIPLAPLGALLALGGWFLIISRLRSSGPEEFLELVEKVAESGPPPGG